MMTQGRRSCRRPAGRPSDDANDWWSSLVETRRSHGAHRIEESSERLDSSARAAAESNILHAWWWRTGDPILWWVRVTLTTYLLDVSFCQCQIHAVLFNFIDF
jgi:hypothetical protein